MKFQGKTALWFWALVIIGDGVFLYEFLFVREEIGALIIGAVIFNLVCIPVIIRNDITEVRTTHDIIASTAASLDRISIKGRRNELMCAVKDKKGFFEEIKRKNKNIIIR